MGVSTDAILFWGYCWDEEGLELLPAGSEDDDSLGWREIVLRNRGERSPWDDFPPGLNHWDDREQIDAWTADHREAIRAWSAKLDDIGAQFGCDLGDHGSDKCSMPYVYLVRTALCASRGYPKRLHPAAMTEGSDWPAELDRWMNELAITPPEGQKPGWWLVSWWG